MKPMVVANDLQECQDTFPKESDAMSFSQSTQRPGVRSAQPHCTHNWRWPAESSEQEALPLSRGSVSIFPYPAPLQGRGQSSPK